MMMEMKPRRVTSYTMILKEKLRRRRMEERMSAKRKAEAPLSECTGKEESRKVARLTNDDEDEEEDTKDQRIRLVELGSDPMKGWTVCEEGDDDMMEKLDRSQSEDAFECVPCNGDEGTSSEDSLDENDDDDTQACTEIASAGGGSSSIAGTSKGKRAEMCFWTSKEDAILSQWVTQNEGKHGVFARLVREKLPHRTRQQCWARWHHCLKPGIKKKDIRCYWTSEEDAMLVEWVTQNGAKDFGHAAEKLPHRTRDQCWQRWHDCLDPAIKKEPWSNKEDKILIDAHKKLGNKWAAIRNHLPGRTGLAIRDRWRSKAFQKKYFPN